jgi:hypothetical protein
MKKIFVGLAILVGVLAVALGGAALALRHSLPDATPGPDGDALAKKVAAKIGADAWNLIGAVQWSLGGRHFLWDKAHGFVRVRWKKNEVLYDLMKHDGRAFHDGAEVSGDERQKLLDKGYALFCNDSFWLNPLPKIFDEGTSRAAVIVNEKPALLVAYASGGVTPGDKYLWLLDDDGMPRAWRVWVKVIPVPGVEFTWEDWTHVDGALVATHHKAGGLIPAQTVADLAVGARPELVEPGPDPFAALRAKR